MVAYTSTLLVVLLAFCVGCVQAELLSCPSSHPIPCENLYCCPNMSICEKNPDPDKRGLCRSLYPILIGAIAGFILVSSFLTFGVFRYGHFFKRRVPPAPKETNVNVNMIQSENTKPTQYNVAVTEPLNSVKVEK